MTRSAFPNATRLVGDRNGDLGELATGEWDATIDVCAYVPHRCAALLTTLDKRTGHYTFISTISVYDDDAAEPGSPRTPHCSRRPGTTRSTWRSTAR